MKPATIVYNLRAGLIKRLHVNRQTIARDRKNGTRYPALTIQTSRGSLQDDAVAIHGPSKMVYRPDKPLSCGAVAWIETTARVLYTRRIRP